MDQDILLELNPLICSLLGVSKKSCELEAQKEGCNTQNTLNENCDSIYSNQYNDTKFRCNDQCKLCNLIVESKCIHQLLQSFPQGQEKIPITFHFLQLMKNLNIQIDETIKIFNQLNRDVCEENSEVDLSLTSEIICSTSELHKSMLNDCFKWVSSAKLPNYFYKNKKNAVYKVCSEGVYGKKVHELLR